MKDITRRDFLKVSGTAAATTALASCGIKDDNADGEVEEDPAFEVTFLADDEVVETRLVKEGEALGELPAAPEKEGFAFTDGAKPTSRHVSDFIAVNPDRTVNYVGTAGRIAFGSGAETVCGERLVRIEWS